MLFVGFPEEIVENRILQKRKKIKDATEAEKRLQFVALQTIRTSCLKKALLFAAFNCFIIDIFHAVAIPESGFKELLR